MLLQVNLMCLFIQCLFCEISGSMYLRNEGYSRFRPYDYGERSPNWNQRFVSSLHTPSNSHYRRDPQHQWDQNYVHNDELDFHYPKVEFLTKIDRKYTGSVSEDIENDLLPMRNHNTYTDYTTVDSTRINRKSNFKKQRLHKNVKYQPVKLSFAQNTPELNPNHIIDDKYKEYEVVTEKLEYTNLTKNNIHELLKNYLLKLYSMKHSDLETTSVSPSELSTEYSTEEDSKVEAENKFVGNVFSKLKQKVVNKSKLFSLFTIVQFDNTQCNATSSSMTYSGVCYTAAECTRIQGTAVGNCASGYGVCCVGKQIIST